MCSSACGQCRGSGFTNSKLPTSTSEEDDGLDAGDENADVIVH